MFILGKDFKVLLISGNNDSNLATLSPPLLSCVLNQLLCKLTCLVKRDRGRPTRILKENIKRNLMINSIVENFVFNRVQLHCVIL